MNRDEILKMSRRENQNKDLVELDVTAQAGNIAGRVGASVCCFISVIFHCFTGTLLYSPWIIYFSILGTHQIVKFHKLKRKSDLFLSIVYLAMCLLGLTFWVLRLVEVAG